MIGDDDMDANPPATPAVILVAPQLGENIGAAARAMANFGLGDLRLVAPRDGWPSETAEKAAAGATKVIEGARLAPTTTEAVAEFHWVCATTARPRDMAKPVMTPEQAARELHRRVSSGERCAILFGPERSGLANDDAALADVLVIAPVDPGFASLNLAQAVLVMAYEWMKGSHAPTLGRETAYDGPAAPGPQDRGFRPATKQELIGFFEHLERELDDSGFLRPPEKRPVMVRNIRNLFGRLAATEQEIRTLRGIVASLVHAHRRGRGAS